MANSDNRQDLSLKLDPKRLSMEVKQAQEHLQLEPCKSNISANLQLAFEANQQQTNKQPVKIKPTLKRYVILFLFCLNAGNKAFQWIQVPSSTTKATLYYGVENYVINSLSVLFTLSFIVLSWPACFLIDYLGMRKAVLFASFGTAVGSIVKCFSCYENGIWLLIIAQAIVSLSEQLIFSLPTRLASVWFPDKEVSRAQSFCVLGLQIGVAVGFIVPKFFLHNANTKDEIGIGFYNMYLVTMVLSVAAFVLDYVFFDEAPEHPPGLARLKQLEQESIDRQRNLQESLGSKIKSRCVNVSKLLTNVDLVLLAVSYGFRTGLNDAISTILDQMMKHVWPDDDLIVGEVGFVFVLTGSLLTPFWGHLLDKLHCYKFLSIFLNVATLISVFMFGTSMIYLHSKLATFISAALMGFFMLGSIVASHEYSVELTYPTPELFTTTLMNIMPMTFCTGLVYICSHIVDSYGLEATFAFCIGCLIIPLVMLIFTRETKKRQNAVRENQ